LKDQRSALKITWEITAPIFPFVIFLILGVLDIGSVGQKVTFAFIAVFVWIFALVIGYFFDWQKRRLSDLLDSTSSDCIISLWEAAVEIRDDGSCIVRRTIEGINNAEERRYFEFVSYHDVWEVPSAQQPRPSKITAEVRKGGREFSTRILHDVEFLPKQSAMRMHQSYSIPVAGERDPPLRKGDSFAIKIEESLPEGTWKKNGDFYSHSGAHVTQKLVIKLNLPKGWNVVSDFARIKSPTTSVWKQLENVEVTRKREGTALVVEVEYPKLFHVYQLGYKCNGVG